MKLLSGENYEPISSEPFKNMTMDYNSMKFPDIFLLFLVLLMYIQPCISEPNPKNNKIESSIHGYVAEGFEPVRDAFVQNFEKRGEIGAAVCAYYKGQKVVDLWGGYRDPQKKNPWEEHTMIIMFSTTKGMTAVAVAKEVSRGVLAYDEKVSRYWPEFAQNGKADITVRQLMNHEAGLPAFDKPISYAKMKDLDSLAVILAAQKPFWTPGTKHGYHSSTLGMYANELIRQADCMHRSLGTFFQDEIAEPLGIDFFIGLPDSVPDSRLAKVKMFSPPLAMFKMPWKQTKGMLNPKSLFFKTMMLPNDAKPNERDYLRIEQGSGNGVGEVRGIAKVYGELAMGGAAFGMSPEVVKELAEGTSILDGKEDVILKLPAWYNLGFLKPGEPSVYGTSSHCFGAPGLGGSFAFADPDYNLGYAYAMVKMEYKMINDPREKVLRDAVYSCIKKVE
jgi:CubicO group peptidase (beta-lactamase class C family)